MSNTVKFPAAPVAALALNVAASLKTREEERAAKAAADAAAKAAKAAAKAAKSGKSDDTSSEATSLDKMVALTSSLSLADLVSLVAYRTASDGVVDPGTVIDTVGELVDSCVESVNNHLSQTYALTMYVKAILYTEITTALESKSKNKGTSVSKDDCILAASMAASAQIDSEVLLAAGVKSASELRAFVERVAATLIGTSEEDGKPFASARRVGLFATNHFRKDFAEFGEKYNAFINPPAQEVSEASPVQDDDSSLVDESDTDSDVSVDDASHNDLQ